MAREKFLGNLGYLTKKIFIFKSLCRLSNIFFNFKNKIKRELQSLIGHIYDFSGGMLLRGERTLLDKSVRANESITSYKKINKKHTRNYIMDFLVKQFLNTMTLSDFKTSLNDFKLSLRESHHLTLLAPISQNGQTLSNNSSAN